LYDSTYLIPTACQLVLIVCALYKNHYAIFTVFEWQLYYSHGSSRVCL